MGGSLSDDELDFIKYTIPYTNIKNLVETGTYNGDTAITASKYFENVYTIEIHEPLYIKSMERASNLSINNINFILGDSLVKLSEIMPKVEDGAVFFIDAHISGYDSGYNGINRVPLLDELDIILSYKLGPSVFIIDDLRLWKDIKAWDWVHITNEIILEKFQKNNLVVNKSFERDDRFYIFTK